MATLIPALSSCLSRMTSGEKRLAERLEKKLDDSYLVWYDVPIGKKRLHPDFLVVHPQQGLLVLEVKDWRIHTVKSIDPNKVKLLKDKQIIEVSNPLVQARNYALYVHNLLRRDKALVHPPGHPHEGKLKFPYGYGVVFTNITRAQFASSGMMYAIEPTHVICQDEMTESVDEKLFQKSLYNMFSYTFLGDLTIEDINRIRWHIFPDITIPSNLVSETENEEQIIPRDIPYNLMHIMDLQQEQLARSLGEGHRVIHGVSGSGKTLILTYRCEFLAQKQLSKPILVLCFNVALASQLRHVLQEKGVSLEWVHIRHFHGWCREQLKNYRVPTQRNLTGEEYIEHVVNQMIMAVDKGIIPAHRYSAIMIDEGHDFKPEWFKLLVKMVDQQTQSILVLYDDAQNLYQKTRQRRFSFKSVGIKAQGRTTILKVNYRNTAEVLALAYEFAKDVMTPSENSAEEDEPVLIAPQSVGRHGSIPELIRLPSLDKEIQYIAERSRQFYEQGIPWQKIAILYRSHYIGEKIFSYFQKENIPLDWLGKDPDSRFFNPSKPGIKVLTMHSSKGLEFPVVFIAGLGTLPNKNATPQAEARLLYVAMTRSTETLILTYSRESEFTQKMETAYSKVIPQD